MSHQRGKKGPLDVVFHCYHLCVSSFTSQRLIDFIHALLIYYSNTYQTPNHDESLVSLNAHFWQHTPHLITALQPVVDFHHSQVQRGPHPEHALIYIAFVIIAGTSYTNTDRIESDFPNRVRRTIATIPDQWKVLLNAKAGDRQGRFKAMIGEHTLEWPPESRWEYIDNMSSCTNNIRNRLSTSMMHHAFENQDPFYVDLRNAFRGRFYDKRDSYGLGTLDRLNLNVRVNLFLSHYSRQAWGSSLRKSNSQGLPFFPYMAIIQSSGSGKSRLLRELGRTLPLAYGNLGADERKGYPLANKSLRDFLLFESFAKNEIDSNMCELYYEKLLIVAVIIFYLLFSHRDDCKKRVTLPTGQALQTRVADTGWNPAGICEPNGRETGDTSDLFWDVVIAVTGGIIKNPDFNFFEEDLNENDAQSIANELMQLEQSLQDVGKTFHSPRGSMTGECEKWAASSEASPFGFARNSSTIPARSIPDPHFVERSILRYLTLRNKAEGKRLEAIAESLQRVKADAENDKLVLHTLFMAFDESSCLAKNTIGIAQEFRQPSRGEDATISYFRCLRRVAHRMFEKTGVSVFLLFSDTNAKLANFTPQRALDPSARMMPDKEEAPGQVHSPFTELGTESVGVLLHDSSLLDFRKRIKAFSRRWGAPVLNSKMECVSEQVTSIPFDVLRERGEDANWTDSPILSLRKPVAIVNRAEDGQLEAGFGSIGEAHLPRYVTIFSSDEDYVYLGRPLWASSMIHNEKGANWKDMLAFALQKLLGGSTELASDSSFVLTKQHLAAIACRVPLHFVEHSGIAPQLIAEHMAWCQVVSWDRESVYLEYINEPLLATAAAVVWSRYLEDMLRCLIAGYGSYLSNKGDLGEVAACIVLVDAVDRAYDNKGNASEKDNLTRGNDILEKTDPGIAMDQVSEENLSPAKKYYSSNLKALFPKGLTMYNVVSLKEMLESGFRLDVVEDYERGSAVNIGRSGSRYDGDQAWKPKDLAPPGSNAMIFVPPILARADVRFKAIKRACGSVGCRDIPFLFEANVAILTHRTQKGVDLLIPLRLQFTDKEGQVGIAWSCVTVQVKNRRRLPRAGDVAGDNLDPIATGAVTCDAKREPPVAQGHCERCTLMQRHHFGIVLNIHSGIVGADESKLGTMWTFLKSAGKNDGSRISHHGTRAQSLSPPRKRQKQSYAHQHTDGGNVIRNVNYPRSAYLIINGIFHDSSTDQASRLEPGTLRLLEGLVAQETLYGVIQKRTKQRRDSVGGVVAAAGKMGDGKYRLLERAGESAIRLASDEEQLFARKY